MKIIEIGDSIFQFTFKKRNQNSHIILRLSLKVKQQSFDVAYEVFAGQVKKYLIDKGVLEFLIFISHHHEDHFDGCKSFKGCKTYASELFNNDFQEHLQNDDFLKSFMPNKFLIDKNYFRTDKFEIEYLYTPGHNKCEFSFFINSKYLYVGDLIFYNKNGLPSLPYIDYNSSITEYIDSLHKKKYLIQNFYY